MAFGPAYCMSEEEGIKNPFPFIYYLKMTTGEHSFLKII